MSIPAKVVAYLDLLGFKNYITSKTQDGLRLLIDFYNVVDMRIGDAQQLQSTPGLMNAGLRKTFASVDFDSFEEFAPFSDSFFAASTKPHKFVQQLSSLLVDSFMQTASAYDAERPGREITRVTTRTPVLEKSGQVKIDELEENWFPVLFRGGVVFDQAWVVELPAIRSGEKVRNYTLVGPAVVSAVVLEQSKLKGPRIFCSQGFVDQLSTDSRRYVHPVSKGATCYDILWPIAHYIDASPEAEIQSRIRSFILRAANLWKAFNHEDYGIHYFKFLKLVILSSLKTYENSPEEDTVTSTVRQSLTGAGLQLKIDELMDTSFI